MNTADYREIPLEGGSSARVSPEDFGYLRQIGWSLVGGYAMGRWHGKQRYMHRIILEATTEPTVRIDLVVDHINRDKLDNQRTNLRWATATENATNRSVPNRPRKLTRRFPPRGIPNHLTSDQLSLSAAAQAMGLSKQALHNRIARGTFPPRDGEIAGDQPRPYWLRSTVEREIARTQASA